MALSLRTGTGAFPTASGSAQLQIAKPTGTGANDLLLLLIVTAADVIPTAPGGFVMVPGAEITGTTRTTVFQKIATANEPDAYWLNWPSGNGSAGMVAIDATTLTYAGVHQVAVASSDSASSSKSWAQVTNTESNTLLLCFGGFGSSASSTPDAAMTERWDTSNPRIYLMTEAVASSGATGTRTATGSSVASQRCITISVAETDTLPFTLPEEARVTAMPVLVELQGEGVDVTAMPVLVELGAVGVYVTAMPVLVEFELDVTGDYAVASGHNIPASFLQRLSPQPANTGIRVTRRDASHSGDAHQDDALYTVYTYDMLESVEQYRAVLDQWGLLTAKTNLVTATARDQDQNWQRWNGTVTRPRINEDVRWERYFPRSIQIYMTELELAE